MTVVDSGATLIGMAVKPYVPRGGWALYQRNRRQRHKAHGLCVFCTAEAIPDRIYCEKHRDYQNEHRKARRDAQFRYVVRLNREENDLLKKKGNPSDVIKDAALAAARALDTEGTTLSRIAKGLFK